MFPRFRQTDYRLQLSLVETRRTDGKVRHEHIASLGSVEWPPSVEARITFWQRLHERLATLSNRVDAAAQAKVLADIHARIPMVTLDEQRALQLENTKADEELWAAIHDMHIGAVEGHEAVAVIAERKIAAAQDGLVATATKRDAAKERRERLERGEDVHGLGKRLTLEDMERILREAGMTKADIDYARQLAGLPESVLPTLVDIEVKAGQRAGRAAVRRFVRHLLESIENDDAA